MAVRSRDKTSFIFNRRRYTSIEAAEQAMRLESDVHGRLVLEQSTEGSDSSVYKYQIPLEPYLYAGGDKTSICGNDVVLGGVISGVDENILTIEWEQLSGSAALIGTPNDEVTSITKTPGEDSDKVFALKVINNETGIINYDKVTVYGTPTDTTEFTFGEQYTHNFLESTHTSQISLQVHHDELENGEKEDRYIRWDNPSTSDFLVVAELYENIDGKYNLVNTQDDPINKPYVKIPVNRGQIDAWYRVRYVYSFNGHIENIWSTNTLPVKYSKVVLALEKSGGHYFNGQASGYTSNSARLEKSSRVQADSSTVSLSNYPSTISNSISGVLRKTKTTMVATDPVQQTVSLSCGALTEFSTTIARLERDQVGGG